MRMQIEKKLDEVSMREGEILARFTMMARGDFSPFLSASPDGQTFVLDLSSEEAQNNLYLVRKLTQTEYHAFSTNGGDGENGEVVRRRTEIELHDAKDALKELARVRGMLVQKHELTGADGGPVEVDVVDVRERLLRRLSGVASRIGAPGDHQRVRGNGGQGS